MSAAVREGDWRRAMRRARAVLVLAALACSSADSGDTPTPGSRGSLLASDSLGTPVQLVNTIPTRTRDLLAEGSGLAMSVRQPGVLFTINDAGHEAILFALDTTGADRGAWRIAGATNVDWESIALGPCRPDEQPVDEAASAASHAGDVAQSDWCVFIGDTGDNSRRRSHRTIYRVPEPAAADSSFLGMLSADRLDFRYPDTPHDVEAMYRSPDGALHLITKRPLIGLRGRPRPALVFRLAPDAWDRRETVTAERIDSLPIVPGSALLRLVTDASLSRDARLLAVRTYAQVYIFATDSVSGRVDHGIAPATCNVLPLAEHTGEGITWLGASRALVLSHEGRRTPLHVIECPPPPLGAAR